jgi:hypothetical protein
MALEGQLRDLSLTEVLQLLALGRKQGVLHVEAPLKGRRGQIVFRQGLIIDAVVGPATGQDRAVHPHRRQDDAHAVEDAVLDVLAWREGSFRFAPGEDEGHASVLRLPIEPLLMEATLRAEVWARIDARVPHAHVVPAFVDGETQQLPLLRLSPAQWELLTRIDGAQDLVALAASTGRSVVEVAEMVHDLIAAGVLALHDAQVAPRRNPTPPAQMAIAAPADLWIPDSAGADDGDFDSVFDPLQAGLMTPLPAVVTPVASPVATPATPSVAAPVAPAPSEPSLEDDALRLGAERARAGDLSGALAIWQQALLSAASSAVADQLRELIAVASRFDMLLTEAEEGAHAHR